jgi:sugar phosphate permease
MSTSDNASRFPLLSYFAVALLFGPMLAVALVWAFLVAAGYLGGTGVPAVREVASHWLAFVLAGGAVCLVSEWLILPLIIATRRRRSN